MIRKYSLATDGYTEAREAAVAALENLAIAIGPMIEFGNSQIARPLAEAAALTSNAVDLIDKSLESQKLDS